MLFVPTFPRRVRCHHRAVAILRSAEGRISRLVILRRCSRRRISPPAQGRGWSMRPPFFLFVLPKRKNGPRPVEERKGRSWSTAFWASPSARGKSVLPLPVAEEGSALFPQRSENTRISVSPKCFPGTARWRRCRAVRSTEPEGGVALWIQLCRVRWDRGPASVPSCPLLPVFNIKIPVSTKRFYRLVFIRDRLFFTIEQKQFCIQSAMLIIYLTNEGACLTFKPV